MRDIITPESLQWTTQSGVTIIKDTLYDLYFNKKFSKRKICEYYKCSEKIIDKCFKNWKWTCRKNIGEMVGNFMKNKSVILKHLDDIKKDYLIDKKTCKEIGDAYGVCESSIARMLKKNGVIIRQLQDAQVKRLVIDKDKIYDLYVNQKKNCAEIANLLHSSDEVIRRTLIQYDITRRGQYDHFFDLIGARKILKEGSEEEIAILKEKISKSKRKYFEKDIDNKLIDKKIIRISKIDKNNKVLLRCLCDGFEWRTNISHIMRGSGCPQCRFKNQKETFINLHNLLSEIELKTSYLLTTYVWENKERKLYVDFFFVVNDRKIIVEYNGEQHYRPVKFNGIKEEVANINFERQQIRDQVLRDYCGDNDIILIEIDGRDYNIYKNNIKEYLTTKIKEIL